MTQDKSIGLVGLGYWGKNILRNLYDLKVLHTACDSNLTRIAERKQAFPNVHYTSSFDEMLEDEAIQAIAIATPAESHHQLIKKSLLAHKDVYVEKPLAMTVQEGEELVQLAKEKNRILMIGHILQYHPAVLKLKEFISEGRLGDIQYIYSNRLNNGRSWAEENILWSFASHDVSVILMLLEEEPVHVSAFGDATLDKKVYNTTLTTLEFRNNVKAHIFVSWLHPYKEQKLVVTGSEGMVVFDDVSEEKLFYYPHKSEWKEQQMPKGEYQMISFNKKEPLNEELKHFISCLESRIPPPTDGKEGLQVLRILERAERSLFNGKS
ncbi:MAG: oxidoreductase [bacterium]|nr:MAG: oxidoreductase [bacterium]